MFRLKSVLENDIPFYAAEYENNKEEIKKLKIINKLKDDELMKYHTK